MTVDQLPAQVWEFVGYLNGLLARLDQGGGWCAVFWQRDPDGMQACVEGREVPPWDVVEALLQDLAARHGSAVAVPERERARALHAAALTAYDALPGGRDALDDRLDVMLREQRYAATRQAALARRLASAATGQEADTVRLNLAWARDDHERATARCAELRARIENLTRRPPADPARRTNEDAPGYQAPRRNPARPTAPRPNGPTSPDTPIPTMLHQRTTSTTADWTPDWAAGTSAAAGSPDWTGNAPTATGSPDWTRGTSAAAGTPDWALGTPAAAGTPDWAGDPEPAHPTSGVDRETARSAFGADRQAAPAAFGVDPEAGRSAFGVAHDRGAGRSGSGVDREAARPGPGPGSGREAVPPVFGADRETGRTAFGVDREAGRTAFGVDREAGRSGSGADHEAARPSRGSGREAAPHAFGGEAVGARPAFDAAAPTERPEPGSPPQASPGPTAPQAAADSAPGAGSDPASKPRKRRRGSARFAGMAEDVAPAAVVPSGVPALPASAPAARRTPRGARFAGAAAEDVARPSRQEAQPVDAEARQAVARAVETLTRLRAEGRSGEAHALLLEAAHWPAGRLPLLAAELQHAGLGADWTTLLWEAASLPADRLVAAADALVAAGRDADGQRIMRQGVARPDSEIGEAVLGLADQGRDREVSALLDAYVRVRTPEQAAHSVRPDPRRLVPLLLRAARDVSDERHWDLVHALRVAGFAA